MRKNKKSIGVLFALTFILTLLWGGGDDVYAGEVDGLEYVLCDMGDYYEVAITGYNGSDTTVVIPEKIEGAMVTRISDYAFKDCSYLTEVNIPAGVTSIGDGAFRACSSLTEINIPDGVTDMGWEAFSGCSSLTKIKIPEGVTMINAYLFLGCSKLTSVELPNGLEIISINAFSCCGLTEIDIPESVIGIGYGAFQSCDFTEIKLPKGITDIDDFLFAYCSNLKEISIPEGVTSIGMIAFEDCSSLESVEIPESVTSVDDSAFSGCDKLTDIYYAGNEEQWKTIIDTTATNYPSNAVVHYNYLNSGGKDAHKLNSTVTKATTTKDGKIVKECAGCNKITSTTTINKIKTIKLSTTTATYDGKVKTPTVTVKDSAGKTLKKNTDYTLTYSKGRKNIGTYTVKITFKGKYSGIVKKTFKITAPKNKVYTVGANKYKVTGTDTVAFNGLKSSSTTKVTVPSTVKIGGKTFKVTSVAANALKGKTKVTSVTVGEKVKTIGANAFYGCKKLSKITVKSTVLTSVGKNALKGIKATATIKVPAKKLASYKKVFKSKGQGSKVKITK